MRTKMLLAAAAFVAAGVATSMAQSNVYSLNVVGYVNKAFPAFQFVLVNNPLAATNNTLNAIIPTAPDGSTVFKWSVANQDLDVSSPTFITGSGWSPNSTVSPGEGFFVVAGEDFTNTFVGEVRQGALSTPLVGNFAFEAVGSQVPVGGTLSSVLTGYPAADGDTVFPWSVANQDLSTTSPTFITGSGWTPDINIGVGEGFFLSRAEGPVNWVRNFTVQ